MSQRNAMKNNHNYEPHRQNHVPIQPSTLAMEQIFHVLDQIVRIRIAKMHWTIKLILSPLILLVYVTILKFIFSFGRLFI